MTGNFADEFLTEAAAGGNESGFLVESSVGRDCSVILVTLMINIGGTSCGDNYIYLAVTVVLC